MTDWFSRIKNIGPNFTVCIGPCVERMRRIRGFKFIEKGNSKSS